MKLIESDGRFGFIKNGQVEIDETLLKYTRLLRKESEPDKEEDAGGESLSVFPGADLRSGTEMIEEIPVSDGGIDYKTRIEIAGDTVQSLREFLKSESAAAFNDKYHDMLTRELNGNSYSLQVTHGRRRDYSIIEYGEPYDPSIKKQRNNFFSRLGAALSVLTGNKEKKVKKKGPRIDGWTVMEALDLVHAEFGKEQECLDKIAKYLDMLRNAIDMGQTALADNVCQGLIRNIYESVLATHGFNRYLTFANIERLKSPGKREVDIDYIVNFNRVIPDDVIELKKKADKLCVFDNYAVIYYDPTGKTYDVPQKAKRDPILVGLINHSEKLYFVGDWVDELCDLTLDEIASRGIEINTVEE